MKKKEMLNKLKAFGVKVKGPVTIGEAKEMLAAVRTDTSKPGHNIGKTDITSAIGAKQP